MTLFDPLFADNAPRLREIDAAFVRVHAILFSGKHEDQLQQSMDQYLKLLDPHIGRTTKRWLETGCVLVGSRHNGLRANLQTDTTQASPWLVLSSATELRITS